MHGMVCSGTLVQPRGHQLREDLGGRRPAVEEGQAPAIHPSWAPATGPSRTRAAALSFSRTWRKSTRALRIGSPK